MLFADSQVLGPGLAKLFQEVLPIWDPIVAKLVRRLPLCGWPREMASGAPALLLLSLLCLPSLPPGATSCPAACRCYSTTVECGALGLHVVPPGIPPGTQVGTVWGRGRGGEGV